MKKHFLLSFIIIPGLIFLPVILFGQSTAGSAKMHKPFVLGQIDELYSKELGENRTINIYLPEGYDPADSVSYPVVYLLDGSADEDFIHIVGLYQFNSFPWINRVPKSIIVGIANVDRLRDFTFPTSVETAREKYKTSGKSQRFIAFMQKELQPYIKANYKSNQSKTLIGESLGGLLAAEILLSEPSLFNQYIIISPSLWWDNGSLLLKNATALTAALSPEIKVYIGIGKEGLKPTAVPSIKESDANLLAEKIKAYRNKSMTVYFDYLPQEDHATIGHQAVFNALHLLSSNKKLSALN